MGGDSNMANSSQDHGDRSPAKAATGLRVPSAAEMKVIAQKQDEQARETALRRKSEMQQLPPEERERRTAAVTIQRNYRGYRQRRHLGGLGLDASARWVDAVKEAEYRNLTRPISRREREERLANSPTGSAKAHAQDNWRKAGKIMRRAGADDDTDQSDYSDSVPVEEQIARRRKKSEAKRERERNAKQMDLQYFLEMVDQKHRYGSNLRTYHREWMKTDTKENFFYWLDYGEGRDVDLEERPRERLDREQVRYLSREERQHYLVTIDSEGRFRWAKNNARIDTSEGFKDSIYGVVPIDDNAPSFRDNHVNDRHPTDDDDDDDTSLSSLSESSTYSQESGTEEADRYVNDGMSKAKGIKKVTNVSAAGVLNHLLRKTTKKNTWIFVADTSFRLYVGLKQSGAFQHSSFIHGSRISAAGLLKIKNGQLRSLSPLSGHYRPPTSNFTAFVASLRNAGCDMSRVSISKSYAVLAGLESYKTTKAKIKHVGSNIQEAGEKLVHPDVVAARREAERDKSASAERERVVLTEEREREERRRREMGRRKGLGERLRRKFGIGRGGKGKEGEDAVKATKEKGISDEHGE